MFDHNSKLGFYPGPPVHKGITIVLSLLGVIGLLLCIVWSFVWALVNRYTRTEPKLKCHVHERHHRMDFENVEVVRHEAHYHQWLFLAAWMSVKDPNAGNDPMAITEVYKCLARA